ncbi:TPA: hypothetical protein ACWV5T_002367 [Salmonella enterica subsp. enterica serovar Muenchen]
MSLWLVTDRDSLAMSLIINHPETTSAHALAGFTATRKSYNQQAINSKFT